MFALNEVLTRLAGERPLFHSEADFQHSFAWMLQRLHPELAIRLEVPLRVGQDAMHIDLLASSGIERRAVELKYKTRGLALTALGEEFRLTNQAAQDLGRYDFIKDIRRIETVVASQPNTSGFAVLLTNDSSYWRAEGKKPCVDSAFRLYPERTLQGELRWDAGASAGTTRGRETALALTGSYPLAWREYSHTGLHRYGVFKYLAVQIPPAG